MSFDGVKEVYNLWGASCRPGPTIKVLVAIKSYQVYILSLLEIELANITLC